LQIEDSCFYYAENELVFMITKIENNHICGAACKDIRNRRFTCMLIKELIHDEVRDKTICEAERYH